MKKLVKKSLVLMLLAMALSPVFANGEKEQKAAAPTVTVAKDPVEIQFWTRQTQSERQEKIQVLIDVFEVLNPDIKVTMLPVEDN